MKFVTILSLILVSMLAYSQDQTQDLVFDNNKFIYFRDNTGTNDGVRIGRHTGDALRIRYFGNSLAFDALNDKPVVITNSLGVTAVRLDPAGGNSYLREGSLGLGVTSPSERLEIDGVMKIGNGTDTWRLVPNGDGSFSIKETGFNGALNIFRSGALNVDLLNLADGNVGVGTTSPQTRLNVKSEMVDESSTANTAANLLIEASGSRDLSKGAVLGFELPANVDGTNPWQHGRIMVLPDNPNSGRADGKMLLQTRFYNGAWDWRDNLALTSAGRVGIGTQDPQELLTVQGAGYFHEGIGGIKIDAVTTEQANGYVRTAILSSRDGDLEWDNVNDLWTLGSGTNNDFTGIIHRNNGKLSFYTGPKAAFTTLNDNSFVDQFERLTITGSGNVGIGTDNPSEKLEVAGTVYSQEVKVEVAAGTGPDYVFESDYELRTLEEVEDYIKENKHLPEIPSAKEMEANGVELGEMNMLLLKKIEELTLHSIEASKLRQTQQSVMQAQDLKIKELIRFQSDLLQMVHQQNELNTQLTERIEKLEKK